MASQECCLHFHNVQCGGNIYAFSDISLQRVIEFSSQWIALDGEAQSVSSSFRNLLETHSNSSFVGGTFGFHRECYQRLTNKTTLQRAEKRLSKATAVDLKVRDNDTDRKRMTRQSNVSAIGKLKSRNSAILPDICIICQKDQYTRNKNGAYTIAKLTLCETDGRTLQAAAEEKQDEKVLLHIRGCTDLAAAEVQYHKKCYRAYTRKVGSSSATVTSDTDEGFEQFCSDIVAGKLYQDKCVLTFSKIFQLHVDYARQSGCAPYAKKQNLKSALRARYPGLQFFQPHQKNKSELVYAHSQSLARYGHTCNCYNFYSLK